MLGLLPLTKRLAGLLHRAARSLEESTGLPSQAPARDELEEPPGAGGPPREPGSDQPVAPPSPQLGQQFVSALRARLRRLRTQPWTIALGLGLAVAIIVSERWLIAGWQWLVLQISLNWPTVARHPVALSGVGVIVFYLLFGLGWLWYVDDLTRWVLRGIKAHPRISGLVAGVLLLIGLWLANNRGTWVVLPFTVGQIESGSLTGEAAASQLIAELSQVGVGNPTPVFILWEPQEPYTSSGSVTMGRDLPLEECDVVLRGPGDFIAGQRIPLPTVETGTQGSRLDLGNLSIGTINIPSQLFTQYILKIVPTGYREFTGQIVENQGELEISVSSRNPPGAWRVAGPSEAFPTMMEYLALRIALDLNPELVTSSGLNSLPSDRDLAFAMGNQAFREQRYQQARNFYELADDFAPLDEKIDAMLGLTHYHLVLNQRGEDPARFDTALRALEAAVQEDPNGESSLLRPYLACLYQKAGREEQADMQRAIFATYLRRESEVRVEALRRLPTRGPGRHLLVLGGDVILVDAAGAIVGAAGRPLTATLSLPAEAPRQLGIYGEANLLFVSPDGAVLTYDYQVAGNEQQPLTLIQGRTLNGVQQIGSSISRPGRTNLIVLNRFGQIYWCEPEAQAGSPSACRPRPPISSELPAARQIFPVKDRLYLLASDGAVWRTEIGPGGPRRTPKQVTPPDSVQEIVVSSDDTVDTVYLLHDNGNVWRYYDDGRPETEDLKLIDPGTQTSQLFAAGGYLYVLKTSGAVWRISHPRDPAEKDYTEIIAAQKDTTVLELFVTEQPPGARSIYLLTDQKILLRGIDTGDEPILPTQIYPDIAQAAAPR